MVVAFIDQRCSAVFETIPVRCIAAHRHQNDGMIASKAEIHSPLEADTFAPTHFVMRENVVAHVLTCDARSRSLRGEFTGKR